MSLELLEAGGGIVEPERPCRDRSGLAIDAIIVQEVGGGLALETHAGKSMLSCTTLTSPDAVRVALALLYTAFHSATPAEQLEAARAYQQGMARLAASGQVPELRKVEMIV